jgi:hypothetical protein
VLTAYCLQLDSNTPPDSYTSINRIFTGIAKFDIAVNKTSVYRYNQGHVVIAISRNETGSKNPDPIK